MAVNPDPGSRLNLLLLESPTGGLAVAATSKVQLEEWKEGTDGDAPDSLLEAAGMGDGDFTDERILMIVGNEGGETKRWLLPRPDELLTKSLSDLQGISPLMRPHLRVRGLAGFVTHDFRPLAILDPLVLERELPEEGEEGTST